MVSPGVHYRISAIEIPSAGQLDGESGNEDRGPVDDTSYYLNTDLDLTSVEDLSALATAFEMNGMIALHLACGEDGRWSAIFETGKQHTEPETNIAAMLIVVEALPESLRAIWSACTQREFNIGYDSVSKQGIFQQGLSSHLLGRMVAVKACLRVTLYPPATEQSTQ